MSDLEDLKNEYVTLWNKMNSIRTPRPAQIRPGVSWQPREVTEISRQLDDIEEQVKSNCWRDFFLSIDDRLR